MQIHDEVPETTFNTVLSPVNLVVENFSTVNAEDRGSNELLVAFENEASLRMISNFIVSPLQWEGELALENFSLLTPWPYFRDTAPFVLDRGLLDLTFAYNVTLPAEGLNVLIDTIQLQLSQVVAHEADEQPFIDGGTLTLSNGSFAYPDMMVAADDLILADLTLRLLQSPEGELNLTRIVSAFGSEP